MSDTISDTNTESGTNTKLPTMSCVIEGQSVLLPGIAVAEVIDYQAGLQNYADGAPDWLLGKLNWRGLQIPLVSLEGLDHAGFFSQQKSLKIVVVNALFDLSEVAYWGFVSLETPKLHRISAQNLLSSDDSLSGAVISMQAELDQHMHGIVNLQSAEQLINETLQALVK